MYVRKWACFEFNLNTVLKDKYLNCAIFYVQQTYYLYHKRSQFNNCSITVVYQFTRNPQKSFFLSSFLSFGATAPQWARASSIRRFLNHTQRLWTSDQPVAETSTWQHTTLTTDKHPCPRCDSNPQSQQASGRRPRGHWDRLRSHSLESMHAWTRLIMDCSTPSMVSGLSEWFDRHKKKRVGEVSLHIQLQQVALGPLSVPQR